MNLSDNCFIWEPACGENDLLNAMIERSGAEFYGSDISYGADFYNPLIVPSEFSNKTINSGIITNPPYSEKPQWLKRCFEISQNIALLLPVESLASKNLRALWDENGGVSVILLESRVEYRSKHKSWLSTVSESSNFPSAWFISGFGIRPDNIFHGKISTEKNIFKKFLKDGL